MPAFIALLVTAASLAAAEPTGAATVAYTDGGNLMLASPDGAHKLQLTSDGGPGDPWYGAAQSADGSTVAAKLQTFEGDKRRPVLHHFSASDGTVQAANVMPVSSGAIAAVYPIGVDVDDAGTTVAFGYSYCPIAGCGDRRYGYWLTFADPGPGNPSNPQGSSGPISPSFYGNRIVSSDTYKIMVQEPANAPFTDGHQGWILPGNAGARFWAAEVAPGVRQVAIEYTYQDQSGVVIASGDGQLGGQTQLSCLLPTAAGAQDVSYSPDATLIAWQDADGVRVAGAPDLAKPPGPDDACVLSAPATLISATGADPNLGGGDVAAKLAARASGGRSAGGAGGPGGGGGAGATPPSQPARGSATITLSAPARARLAKGVAVRVTVPGAGRVTASLTRKRKLVASGSARAARAGTLTVKLRATRNATRSMRGKTLALRVDFLGADGRKATATASLRAR